MLTFTIGNRVIPHGQISPALASAFCQARERGPSHLPGGQASVGAAKDSMPAALPLDAWWPCTGIRQEMSAVSWLIDY